MPHSVEEKKKLEEHANSLPKWKVREEELEKEVEENRKAKQDAIYALKTLGRLEAFKQLTISESQHKASADMLEFYKKQLDDWKRIHNEQKEQLQKQIELAGAASKARVLELEAERELLIKQASEAQKQRNAMHDILEKETVQRLNENYSESAFLQRSLIESLNSSVQPSQTANLDVIDLVRENQLQRDPKFGSSSRISQNFSRSASLVDTRSFYSSGRLFK